MYITENDIRMFYQLLHHYNTASPNIAVVGDNKKFNRIVQEMINLYKDTNARVIKGIKTLRILTSEDIEISYIQVESVQDLTGLYFKKFI